MRCNATPSRKCSLKRGLCHDVHKGKPAIDSEKLQEDSLQAYVRQRAS